MSEIPDEVVATFRISRTLNQNNMYMIKSEYTNGFTNMHLASLTELLISNVATSVMHYHPELTLDCIVEQMKTGAKRIMDLENQKEVN